MSVNELVMPCHWCAPHMDDESFMFQIYMPCQNCDGDIDGCAQCGQNFNHDCAAGEVSYLSHECPECYQDIRQTRAAMTAQTARISAKKETQTMTPKTPKNMTDDFKAKTFSTVKKADKKGVKKSTAVAPTNGYFKSPVVLHLGYALDSGKPLDVVRPSGIRIDKPAVIAEFLAKAVMSDDYLNIVCLRQCDEAGNTIKEYSGANLYDIVRDWAKPILNSANKMGFGKEFELYDLTIHALRIDANRAALHQPLVDAWVKTPKAQAEIALITQKPEVVTPGMEFLYGRL